MAHGYAREYDEGWDRGDDRDRDWRGQSERQERGDRDWRDRDSVWRGDRESHEDRGRGFMLSDDDRGAWENNRDWPQRNRGFGPQDSYGSDQQRTGYREGGAYSANPDDHYRSWRDRQMQSLDRDYQDYCREREQQFHRDFDSWRQNRQSQGSQTQQSQPGGGSDEPVMELNNPTRLTGEALGSPSGTSDATLGTNNSENSVTPTGRGRR